MGNLVIQYTAGAQDMGGGATAFCSIRVISGVAKYREKELGPSTPTLARSCSTN